MKHLLGGCVFVAVFYPVVIWWHFDYANRLLKQRDTQSAAGWLRRLEWLYPFSGDVHFLKARHARLRGDHEEMVSNLESARQRGVSPERLHREEVLANVQSGELAEYEQVARRFLVEPGDDASEICEAIINGLLLNYRLADANELLGLWEKDFPDEAQPLVVRARVSEQLGEVHRAIELYQQAAQLAPGRRDIKRRLFISLVTQHRYQDASTLLESWSYEAENDVDFLIARATLLSETGKPQDARTLLEQAAKSHPSHRQLKLLLAREYFREGRTDEVLAIVRPYLKASPKDYDFRYLIGQALSLRGDPEAKSHLDYVSEADKMLQKISVALDNTREKPQDAEGHFEIGKSLLEYGYQTQGVGWLRSTLQLEPHHQGALELLANHYDREGNAAMAKMYRKMLKR